MILLGAACLCPKTRQRKSEAMEMIVPGTLWMMKTSPQANHGIKKRRQPWKTPWCRFVKWFEDTLIAMLCILVTSPIMLLAALIVKLESRGPVLFKQKRGGRNGKMFTIYKFRTMTVDACRDDKAGHATPGDYRVTRIGRFLRATSIDELPQLFNVLKGDMSVIGPRPHMLHHDEIYRAVVQGYDRRFRMKPGLTGLAQVAGFRGMIYENSDMQHRVDADNDYIENWSLWLDIKILCRTVWVVVRLTNAY